VPDRVEVHIPFTTLLKVALTLLLCICVIKLWPVILMIIVAILLAVMLDPIVTFLERHRVHRGLGVAIVAIVLLALAAVVFAFIVPAMSRQLVELSGTLPAIEQSISRRFPIVAPYLQSLHGGPPPEVKVWLTRGLAAGKVAIDLVTAMIFVLIVAVYLLIEGRTAFEWLITLAPENKRPRLRQTAVEMASVILAFMRGEAICCFLCASWTFVLLTLLGIPAALPLAGMAFIADLLPVVGTIAMMIPAVMLALTAGPAKALLVFAGYLLYHLAESYFIIPKVYGSELRLSTLTVILAIMIGGTLQGVAGAILILPFVAAYPIVERLWLRDVLPEDAVARHEELAE